MSGASCPLGRLQVLLLVILTTNAAPFCWGDQEKIALRDIRDLTLYPNELTTTRRSNVQTFQLQCVGGTAGCSANTPEFAICYNRGWDGKDVQWECKLELDNTYEIGKAIVNCEGYDYPEDPYILKGSCGLQYTLEFSKENQSDERAGRPSLATNEEPSLWSRMLNGWAPENSSRSPPNQRPPNYQRPPDFQRPSNYQRVPDNQRHFVNSVTHIPQAAHSPQPAHIPQPAITTSSFPTETRNSFAKPPAIMPITNKIQDKEEEDNISMATVSE